MFASVLRGCLLNCFLSLFLPSPLFLDTSGIWWQDPPSLAAEEASWGMAGMAAPHKAVDEDSDLSHLEGDSAEELGVQDPVSVGLNVELLFPPFHKGTENFLQLYPSAGLHYHGLGVSPRRVLLTRVVLWVLGAGGHQSPSAGDGEGGREAEGAAAGS